MTNRNAEYTVGDFRTPIIIERETSTPDGSGGQSVVWNAYIPVLWTLMENKQGNEKFSDKQDGRIRTFQMFYFTTWWRNDILQTDRINFDGLFLNIRQLNDLDMKHKYLQIVAEAGVEQ